MSQYAATNSTTRPPNIMSGVRCDGSFHETGGAAGAGDRIGWDIRSGSLDGALG